MHLSSSLLDGELNCVNYEDLVKSKGGEGERTRTIKDDRQHNFIIQLNFLLTIINLIRTNYWLGLRFDFIVTELDGIMVFRLILIGVFDYPVNKIF